ncbi:MAG TPA: iron-containing alcohol dehydrogenase [Acidobacteriota bacterium]|nr:iron-containing alcohol dehydrogenase [Acidobacteriota bacterium]
MREFDYDPTTRVVFGENSLDRLGQLASDLGGHRVLLVTDPGIVRAGHVERARQALREAGLECIVFDAVVENPTTTVVERGRDFALDEGGIDFIVGLGGGSSMDAAKGVNFLLTNGGRMEDYWGINKAKRPMLPSIGVPTTAGTGSEAQSFALISQPDTHEKMACGDRKARFRAVILDPVLTASMPADVASVTAMDAISHAVESYVSSKSNHVSRMFAREAWRLLESNFSLSLHVPQDMEARGRMLLGAHWAGAAIENSMLGAAHACANPLTAHFDVTHGVAVSLMLPHVVRYNASVAGNEYHELVTAAGTPNGGPESSADTLSERLAALRSLARLPSRLREVNVGRDAFPALAEDAARQWTGTFNPRRLGVQDAMELYERAF